MRQGRTALINLALIITPILSIEIIIRIAGFIYNDFNHYYLLYGFNKSDMHLTTNAVVFDGYFKFAPASTITQGPLADLRIPSQINNIGLRGSSEIDQEKAGRTIRIITFGGSSTFGYHARDDHTYPFLLEKKLRSKNTGRNIEVINAGIPNFDTENILYLFKKELIHYKPDVITIYTGYNDAVAVLDASAWQSAARWLYDHVAIYVAVQKTLKWATNIEIYSKWSRYVAKPSKSYVDKQIELHVESYRENIQETIDLAQEIGALVVLIRQPIANSYVAEVDRPDYVEGVQRTKARLSSGEALDGRDVTLLIHAALLETLDDLGAENDLAVVDNVSLVDLRKDRLLTYVHLSEEGNDALASALADTLSPLLNEKFPQSETN